MARTISWEALVREVEPDYDKQPVNYIFSNERQFLQPKQEDGIEFRSDNSFSFFDDPGFQWLG